MVPSHCQIPSSDLVDGAHDTLCTAVNIDEYPIQAIVAVCRESESQENSFDNEEGKGNRYSVVEECAGFIDEQQASIARVKRIFEIKRVTREPL